MQEDYAKSDIPWPEDSDWSSNHGIQLTSGSKGEGGKAVDGSSTYASARSSNDGLQTLTSERKGDGGKGSDGPSAYSMIMLGAVHLLIPTAFMFSVVVLTAESKTFLPSKQRIATALVGGSMYTATGLINLLLLKRDAGLDPRMAYTNSIMAWSAFFFGPAIAFVNLATLQFSISYGHWYCVPNFGWGVEWGLQLLGDAGSGLRAIAIMAASIASFFLKYAFGDENTGFLIAFLPQVVGAVAMCAYCFRVYPSDAAAKALVVWVSMCMCFLVLENFREPLEPLVGHSAHTLAIQCCDCCQIHFSTRFFVCMFRTKHAMVAAGKKSDRGSVMDVTLAKHDTKVAAGPWWY